MAFFWAAAVVQIFAEFFTAPHTIQTMRLMSALTFIFVGAGCSALCAWLIQRSTLDPYQDFAAALEHVHRAAYDLGYAAGYDAGYRAGRGAVLGIVPFPHRAADASDDQDEPPGKQDRNDTTGTDGPALR